MENVKPTWKEALKSIGFGALLIYLGTGEFHYLLQTFFFLFGIFVVGTGIKEVYQILR